MKRLRLLVLALLVVVLPAGLPGLSAGEDIVAVTILQTADLHNHASGYGPFLDYPDEPTVVGGYARLATIINNVRGEGNDTLLLDSGDFLMGTPYDITDVTLQFFDMMRYDAVTLGNHEFDWTPNGLAQLLYGAVANDFSNVSIVASNMANYEETLLKGLVDSGMIVPKKVITLDSGLTVGLLGVMGPGAQRDAPMHPPLTFNLGPDAFGNYSWDYDAIQAMVDDLRNNDNADLVIMMSHSGISSDYATGDDINLARNVSGIDIIASGHAHTATGDKVLVDNLNEPTWKTIIFSPGQYGEAISRLDLQFDLSAEEIITADFTLIGVDYTVSEDPIVQGLVNSYNDYINNEIAPLALALPISRTTFDLTKAALDPVTRVNNLGSLCADAVRSATAIYGTAPADVAVVARGVIRDEIRVTQTVGSRGVIPFSDVYTVLPLGISPYTFEPGYPLMEVDLTPFELYLIAEIGLTGSLGPGYGSFYLNFSGVHIEYDMAGAETFSGVKSISLYQPSDTFCRGPIGPPLNRFDAYSTIRASIDLYGLELLDVANGLLASHLGAFPGPFPEEIFPDDRENYLEPQNAAPLWDELNNTDIPEYRALLEFLHTAFPHPGKPVLPAIYGPEGSILERFTTP